MSAPLRSPEAVGSPKGRLESQIALLPTPLAGDRNGPGLDPDKRRAGGHSVSIADVVEHKLLPTPRASHADKGGPNMRDSAGHYDLPAIGKLLSEEDLDADDLDLLGEAPSAPEKLLPTVRAQNGSEQNSHIWKREQGLPQNLENALAHTLSDPLLEEPPAEQKSYRAGDDQEFNGWGVYEAAIRRWERALGIPAPAPTELSPREKHRLSERFTEWMMGLPEGWICDTEGVVRKDAIKAAGNGVVPQQAIAALEEMYIPAHIL